MKKSKSKTKKILLGVAATTGAIGLAATNKSLRNKVGSAFRKSKKVANSNKARSLVEDPWFTNSPVGPVKTKSFKTYSPGIAGSLPYNSKALKNSQRTARRRDMLGIGTGASGATADTEMSKLLKSANKGRKSIKGNYKISNSVKAAFPTPNRGNSKLGRSLSNLERKTRDAILQKALPGVRKVDKNKEAIIVSKTRLKQRVNKLRSTGEYSSRLALLSDFTR